MDESAHEYRNTGWPIDESEHGLRRDGHPQFAASLFWVCANVGGATDLPGQVSCAASKHWHGKEAKASVKVQNLTPVRSTHLIEKSNRPSLFTEG